MAAGDTDVSICNKALMLLASEPITSFSDGSAAASACSTLYSDVKRSTLAMYAWSFSLAKVQLAQDTATPASEWDYQYVMPSDMLTGVPRAVRTSSASGAGLYKNWEIGMGASGLAVLMTNATEVHIDYQKDVAEAQLPSYFVQLLSYQLAWHLADIITDQSAKRQEFMMIALGTPGEGLRGGYFRQAVNADSAGQTPSVIADYILTDVR